MARFGRNRRRVPRDPSNNPYEPGSPSWREFARMRARQIADYAAGGQAVVASLAAHRASIPDIALEATREAAEHVLEVANTTVPLDTGFLRDSGQVVPSADGSGWDILYEAPYAEIQHESSHFVHAPGKRSHWLERTIEEEADNVTSIVESYVGDAIGAGGGVGGRLAGFGGRERRIAPPSRLF